MEFKKGKNMDGIILINKEKGYTSHDIVNIVKKLLNEKVGHTGTLDPNATGVLPLLIGKGTRLSKYLINHDKVYTAVLKLGIQTDTADITGQIINKGEVPIITEKQIRNALQQKIGEQEQFPPMYSAIKVKGKKLYEYARQGKTVEVSARKINIYNLILEKYDNENNEITFTIDCSKGTYIRTLCEDVAKLLNTIGTMKELKRKKVGEFQIENAVTVDELKKNVDNSMWIGEHVITIEQLLQNSPKVVLSQKDIRLFLNGVKLSVNSAIKSGVCMVYDDRQEFIGTGIVEEGKLKRDIVLCYS